MKTALLQVVLAVAFGSVMMAQQAPAPASSPTPAPQKRRPEAKTQAEFDDYKAAYAVATGGAAAEKAAKDFAAKYPASELQPILYSKALHDYQSENNAPKMLEMGEKVLALDPNNSVALVVTATVLSDSLKPADKDQQQKIEKIKKYANRALATMDTAFVPPANVSAEQIAVYKNTLREMAYSALGTAYLNIGDNAGAEEALRTATGLGKNQPDPYVWYNLALAEENQHKYAEALASLEQALKHGQPESELLKLATEAQERVQTTVYYNAALAAKGGAAAEEAANSFAAKHPTSELRSFLYSKALHDYQTENNGPKMLAMGEKVLSFDPNDPVALTATAAALAESLQDADPERQQKVEKIKKNANRALETVDASFRPPAGATPEQITDYKNTLRSVAYSALGITDLKTGNNADAEKELRSAAEAGKARPDPSIWYHLALAQDHQDKYSDALVSVEQAVKFSQPGSELAKLASGERERLLKLVHVYGRPPATNSSQPRH